MSLPNLKASWQAVKAFLGHLRNGKPTASDTTTRRPQEPVPPFPYWVEPVTFANEKGTATLAATLTRPKSHQPCAAVVLVHGSGPHTRDEVVFGHKPFLLLADYLTRRGIAVLRYDKRGVGQSKGDLATATSLDFADDAHAGVRFLTTRTGIDRRRIGILGHSEGGAIVPIVASRTSAVAFVVLLAAIGVSGEELLYLQTALLMQASGQNEDAVKHALAIGRTIYGILKEEPDNERAKAEIVTMRHLFRVPPEKLNEGVEILTSNWFRAFLRLDARPYLAKVQCPILALNGDKDLQVPHDDNLGGIRQALAQGSNSQATLEVVPGVNHLFQTCKTGLPAEYAQIEETIAPAVLQRIGDWIIQQTAKGNLVMETKHTEREESAVVVAVPAGGEIVRFVDGKPVAGKHPVIPFIEGDGIGVEIGPAARKILDAAVASAYGSERKIVWTEIFAGDKAKERFAGDPLPDKTLAAIRQFGVAMKGPLGTPSGGGMRSLNVALRKHFDLYRCVRPVRYYPGVPSRVVAPQELDVVIFRENTEDLYSGIEFQAGSAHAQHIVKALAEIGYTVADDSGIGIKVITAHGSKRLVRSAIKYALEHGRKVVTLVAKGNIMKFTEGAFRAWGYEVAKEEFGDKIVTEDELWGKYEGKLPEGKILVNDRITDAMFAEIILNPGKYSVIATMNLNGDYLSDACAAEVGGLGIAPGANIGDACAIFEATHGTAPDIAGRNIANPTSLLLSGVMMLEYLGWNEAAVLVVKALEKTIAAKSVTGDLARLMPDAKKLSTSEFADAVVANLPSKS